MKIVSLTCISSLLVASTAFHLPITQPKVNVVTSQLDDSSRRNFLHSAGAVIAASLLVPTKSNAFDVGGKITYGDESIMSPKAHGTSANPVQDDLLYGVSNKLADKITNFNRHFAEMGGYFRSTNFEDAVLEAKGPITFYDSVTGKPLFVAPIGRSPEEFLRESEIHGWPSFRDEEVGGENWETNQETFGRIRDLERLSLLFLVVVVQVVWENVRVLKGSGETVSVDGTHLGHNLPDRRGNRYCINLVRYVER